MTNDKEQALEYLKYINPANLPYEDWLRIGTAIKDVGLDVTIWDNWSKTDSRYKEGDCQSKWNGLCKGFGSNPTIATICHFAKEGGWTSSFENIEKANDNDLIDWDTGIIGVQATSIIDTKWLHKEDKIECPQHWNQKEQMIEQLSTLFHQDDFVGINVECKEKENGDGFYPSDKGFYRRTCGEIISILEKGKDIEDLLGTYNKEAGVWLRINPLDGGGVKDINITKYKYALVESDEIEVEKQLAIYKELELPIKTLTHSGGKSLHALVKIDADNYHEYKKRVDFLFELCSKNGLKTDKANRNPSRLSRLAGVMRGDNKQFLLDTNIGQPDWNSFEDLIAETVDDLPSIETYDEDNIEPLAEEQIQGILRKGHKMLVSGTSKAGKSFMLIDLALATSEGWDWLGLNVKQGNVLYLNLELDTASFKHRINENLMFRGKTRNHKNSLDIWNLRGKNQPLNILAPKLIRKARKKKYDMIIIDPIYKVITGDENSASEMAKFTNLFDKISLELNASLVYCHHHSKGFQGDKKSSDRSSGSGVFARDPDAILDLIQLEIKEDILKVKEDRLICDEFAKELNVSYPNWRNEISQDDTLIANCMRELFDKLAKDVVKTNEILFDSKKKIDNLTAWEIESSLREFAPITPIKMYFNYPVHIVDTMGELIDCKPLGAITTKKEKQRKSKKTKEQNAEDFKSSLDLCFSCYEVDGVVKMSDIITYFDNKMNENTLKRKLKLYGYLVANQDVCKSKEV